MTPPPPLPLHWPYVAALAFASVMTFALLGYAMRRMRSRDSLTVLVWFICGAWAIGSGLWAAQALLLLALDLPWTVEVQPARLAIVAAAALACVILLQGIARQRWADATRWGVEALVLSGFQFGLFELALHALGTPPLARTPGWPLHFGLPAFALVLGGAVVALWALFGRRHSKTSSFLRRLWGSAGIAGVCTTAALVLSAQGLAFPATPVLGATPPVGGQSETLLQLGALAALFFVGIGLVSAWLDTHAYQRNKALTSSLAEANLRLRDQAMSDALTRMPNRLLFEERLVEALDEVGDEPCSLAVLFIDLDGFKPINDSFGHVAGDAVLREVGARLLALSRPEDTVARVGGDEFLQMVVRPGHEAVTAAIAQRVLQALEAPFTLPNGVCVNLSASIGIVMYPEHGPAQKLIANADAAMYAAKRAGGSTYAFFEPRMELDASAQLELQHELRTAIERQQLELYYQPKIHALSGQVTGVESLLRWHHPVRGFISPGLFIPVAERFGMIGTIGNWVIDEACRQLREWTNQGMRMRIAVNLSVHQLRQDDLVPRIRLAVEHFGIDPELLTFEITESVAMEDTQTTMKAFEQLAAVGVSLSIDDFGTGYSSLSYLRKLPAQQLKIDQSFVQDLDKSPDALAVIDAVIKLAHALGLTVVAEGVETARQRDMLIALQCDELQGYLFARPMSARLLTLWAMGEHQGGQTHHEDFRSSLFISEPDTLPMLPLQ